MPPAHDPRAETRRIRQRLAGSCLLLAALACFPGLARGAEPTSAAAARPAAAIHFNRDIRPLLSDNCFQCHGPDAATRAADLRLDTLDGLLAKLGDHAIVTPGKPEQSELWRRIASADGDEQMPPSDSGKSLTTAQIALLRRWIEEGARWEQHWSFVPPRRPELPAIEDPKWADWPNNGIDQLVFARLQAEGLTPAPPAARETLLRRVTFDLTGLPPTPAEVDAFLADKSADAYERVVDRLLRSPRFGEHLATAWLDAARYADTNGYQSDGERHMWRWRDWVIESLNANRPFDEFTIEQLAGDLLPNPTLQQRIATGFNRNHRGNAEGGIIPEEYAVEYVVDRVDTTATVWLGLTMGCARCHDHKFDPLSQREFYQLYAFFNNVPEKGKAVKFGNSPPMIAAPTREQQQQLAELERKLELAERHFSSQADQLAAAERRWTAQWSEADAAGKTGAPLDLRHDEGLIAHWPFNGALANVAHEPSKSPASPQESPAARLDHGAPQFVPGKFAQAIELDGQQSLNGGELARFGYYDKFSAGAWVYLEESAGGAILAKMDDDANSKGWNLHLADGHVQANLVVRWLDDSLRVQTQTKLTPGRWQHVMMTYDGSRVAAGVRIYIDGAPQPLQVLLDELNQSFDGDAPLLIGARAGHERLAGRLDDVRIYQRCLSEAEVELLATPGTINRLASIPPRQRTGPQQRKLRAYFLQHAAPEDLRASFNRYVELQAERDALRESFPTAMVMEELPQPRVTHVLLRGEYDKPGERVTAGVPASLPPMKGETPRNRLGLARWLVRGDNPLTARVQVNRYWQSYFGVALVKTAEDFGSQGERPLQADLLDWLATEFIAGGWNIKQLQKTIVMSATYRQSSNVSPALAERDPENRLLARGPRVRLSAQMLRDQALAVSGLLVERLGGPSVRPYQPAGLWMEVSGRGYEQDHGESLYRRSLYTYFKRTVAPPMLATFDAADRETCRVRPARTNTPLQALTLMNDVTFVEAARHLGERMMREGGKTPEQRLAYGFRLATARSPREPEVNVLLQGWRQHQARFANDQPAALQLLSAGESPRDERLPVDELAAYAMIANLLLNLDEVVTKE